VFEKQLSDPERLKRSKVRLGAVLRKLDKLQTRLDCLDEVVEVLDALTELG
jgi:hypothetical protein